MSCTESPNGSHCPHEYKGVWMGVNPPPMTCCWCGKDVNWPGHGSHVSGGKPRDKNDGPNAILDALGIPNITKK